MGNINNERLILISKTEFRKRPILLAEDTITVSSYLLNGINYIISNEFYLRLIDKDLFIRPIYLEVIEDTITVHYSKLYDKSEISKAIHDYLPSYSNKYESSFKILPSCSDEVIDSFYNSGSIRLITDIRLFLPINERYCYYYGVTLRIEMRKSTNKKEYISISNDHNRLLVDIIYSLDDIPDIRLIVDYYKLRLKHGI